MTSTLGLALLKADRMDWAVQKATELGLTALTPLALSRAAVRLDQERAARKVDRWRRISVEAVKQCRRGRPVDIRPPADLDTFLAGAARADLCLVFHVDSTGDALYSWPERNAGGAPPRSICALIGPEGGFTDDEARKALDAGFRTVRLGPRVLRAETAALAALAVIGFVYGDLADFP